MLELLRRAVRSWVAQVLLALLVVSFAVWGIGDVTRGSSTRVATVGGETVEANAFASVLRREQQRYSLDPTQIRATGLDRFVLARMVREAALADATSALGVSAPDDAVARQVRAEPSFQVAGSFDPKQYAAVIQRNFPSIAAYEETLRRSIASGEIVALAQTGAVAPSGEADTLIRWRDERRAFDALTLTAAALKDGPPEPTDADLQAHLEQNAAQFQAPERRTVSWIYIDPAALAAPVSDEDARARYEERRSSYVVDETREIDQVIYPSEQDAQAARARLDSGAADFDGLLAEKGLSRKDAALGSVRKSDLPDARAEAAFGLPAPGVAGPARTATGWALMDVRAIAPGSTTPFEAVKDEIAREIGAERAKPEADRQAEVAIDLIAGGANLDEIATELGQTVTQTQGVTAAGTGADGPPSFQSFRDAAFGAKAGETLDPVRTTQGGYLIMRVDEVSPPVTPPLEAVRALVVESWREAATAEALRDLAASLRTRLDAGETLQALADETGGYVSQIGPLRRIDPDPRLSETARTTLFEAPVGGAAVSVDAGTATLAVVREILPPETPTDEAQALRDALAQSVAQDQIEYLGRALENRAGVTLNPQTIEAVLSQIGA
jgi:peptidyl-prolyl cis-trans isomerase D